MIWQNYCISYLYVPYEVFKRTPGSLSFSVVSSLLLIELYEIENVLTIFKNKWKYPIMDTSITVLFRNATASWL